MKVFISYTTRDDRDRDLALRLATGLRAYGVDLFIAPLSIGAGSDWEELLVAEVMSGCTHFLVIASAAALGADSYVMKEIELARTRRRQDSGFVILQLPTGRIDPPFPNLQLVEYHNDPHHQLNIVIVALGLHKRIMGSSSSGTRTMTDGALIAKLCDRKRQEAQFQAAFDLAIRSGPGIPQVYVIRGERGHAHDSLVDRFIHLNIRPYVEFVQGTRSAAVERKHVAWPSGVAKQQAFDALLTAVFGEISSAHQWDATHPLTPAEWRRLTDNRREPVLVIEHELESAGWQSTDRDVLTKYADFWKKVGAESPTLQCLIFFKAVYATGPLAEKDRNALRTATDALLRLGAEGLLRVAILDDLPSITVEDVEEWFDRRATDYDPVKREQRTGELFNLEASRPMRYVERMLRVVQQELRQSGGYS